MLPCLIFEDEHLLVVNKPAGMNTHAPGPYAGEGLYDWLRHREPRWTSLAIIHRLDKETSGIMVFSKTPLANRSLTGQFTRREVSKTYLLVTDRPVPRRVLTARSCLARSGERYLSRPVFKGGDIAETRFHALHNARLPLELKSAGGAAVRAVPLTGRTHQIRVHAAEHGFPILGDTLYGGTAASRVFLHASEIRFRHPATGEALVFNAPEDFGGDARLALRAGLIDADATDACRLIHGASDGWPGWQVDRLGGWLLSQSGQPLAEEQIAELRRLMEAVPARGVYHKLLSRQVQKTQPEGASPRLVMGAAAPDRFPVRENGLGFELSFNEGYSVGLFLDQRDNRRRLIERHIAADFPLLEPTPDGGGRFEVLNAFAYTCGFSVCAAQAGARVTSLDLSKKYLEWGKRNFSLNNMDLAGHDFIYGDVFEWLRRLGRKGRQFDVVLLDPPTFSQSKESGVFRAERDYGRLVGEALPVLRRGGVLLISTNAATWPPEEFLECAGDAIRKQGRKVIRQHYVPQPPDFPVSRAEPAYLKTAWLMVG